MKFFKIANTFIKSIAPYIRTAWGIALIILLYANLSVSFKTQKAVNELKSEPATKTLEIVTAQLDAVIQSDSTWRIVALPLLSDISKQTKKNRARIFAAKKEILSQFDQHLIFKSTNGDLIINSEDSLQNDNWIWFNKNE